MPEAQLTDRVRSAPSLGHGTYSIVVCSLDEPNTIVAARNGSPVIVGVGERKMFVASDITALAQFTQQVVHLDDGELATINARGFSTTNLDNLPTAKQP